MSAKLEFIFLRWVCTDGLTKLQSQPWLCLFPFMQTSAKFSNFLQPSYTLSQSKLALVGLISHWLSTSMKQLLLVVVEILFSRHKQFWRFWEQILLLMFGAFKMYSRLINHKNWMQITLCLCVRMLMGVFFWQCEWMSVAMSISGHYLPPGFIFAMPLFCKQFHHTHMHTQISLILHE